MKGFPLFSAKSRIGFPSKVQNSQDYILKGSQSKILERFRNYKTIEDLPSLNVYLLNRRISCLTVPTIVNTIYEACISKSKITVANYNIHSFNFSMQLPWFYDFLQSAEITNCDSVGILKAISYMGLDLPIAYRASYTLLMPAVLQKCNEHGLNVFFLGSKPKTLQIALANLSKRYKNISFFGHHGYFDKADSSQNLEVIESINRAKPNILVVGMGMPIQENWVARYRDNLEVNAIMLGGAVIDRLAGNVSDCPESISNIGFEWLYRLIKEPKRLAARYLLGNPAFLLHIALSKLYSPNLYFDEISGLDNLLQTKSNSMKSMSNLEQQNHELHSTLPYSRIKQIVDYFIESELLTAKQIDSALSEPKVVGMLLGELLVNQKYVGNNDLHDIANQFKVKKKANRHKTCP